MRARAAVRSETKAVQIDSNPFTNRMVPQSGISPVALKTSRSAELAGCSAIQGTGLTRHSEIVVVVGDRESADREGG
jgi:hypothetical protein